MLLMIAMHEVSFIFYAEIPLMKRLDLYFLFQIKNLLVRFVQRFSMKKHALFPCRLLSQRELITLNHTGENGMDEFPKDVLNVL